MLDKATITRFIESFVAVFVVAFAGNAIFASGSVDLFGAGGLHAIVEAAVAAAALAARRALAAK